MNSGLRVCCLSLLMSVGCAQILDFPDDPVLGGPWRCLGQTAQGSVPPKQTALVRVRACDFVNQCASAVTGLTARLCSKRDVACTNPITTNIVDVEGELQFEVPTSGTGFEGYLEVSAPTALCTDRGVFGDASTLLCGLVPQCNQLAPDDNCRVPTYARSLLFFNPPVVRDLAQPMVLPMLSSAGLPSVVMAAGAQLDPTTGNLFITAVDCEGKTASGVTYSIAQHQNVVTQLYVASGVVSNTTLRTDESGIGGFVGVPAGFVEVTAYNSDLKTVGKIGVLSAPFTMTYSALVPSE